MSSDFRIQLYIPEPGEKEAIEKRCKQAGISFVDVFRLGIEKLNESLEKAKEKFEILGHFDATIAFQKKQIVTYKDKAIKNVICAKSISFRTSKAKRQGDVQVLAGEYCYNKKSVKITYRIFIEHKSEIRQVHIRTKECSDEILYLLGLRSLE